MLIVVDLECGMGGWSIGFHREGFDCYGVDIVDVGYPYKLILEDIRTFNGEDFHKIGVTAVVASPPCTEFSQITQLSAFKGQRPPPNPEKGLELVRHTKRVIDEIKPKYWVLENVFGARKYIDPILGQPKLVAKPWVLWGNWPHTLFSREPRKTSKAFHHGPWNWSDNLSKGGDVFAKGGDKRGLPEDFPFDPLRSWKRARIPVFLSQSIAHSIRAASQ